MKFVRPLQETSRHLSLVPEDPNNASVPASASLDLEACYVAYAPRLREMICRYTKDPDLAEEVVQETFLRAHRFRDLFDPHRPALPWLTKIAVRLCANELRRRSNVRLQVVPGPGHDRARSQDPAESVIGAQGDALAELSARHRRALVLKYLLGFRYEEIGRTEGISVHGVDVLLRRARRALQRALRAQAAPRETGARKRSVGRSPRGSQHAKEPRRLRGPPRRHHTA